MGQPKTQTIGGGSATGVANQWNSFLSDGLRTGSFGGPTGASTGVGQANSQTNAFGNAINSMLSGRPGDANTFNSYFESLKNAGNGGFNIPQAPQFGDVSGHGAGDLLNYNTNSPEFTALRAIQAHQQNQDVANLRARFAAGGMGSLGSGASLAEGQYLAEANPRNTLALGDLGRQMQMLDMQNRGQNLSSFLNQRGQDIGNYQFGVSSGMENQQMQNQFALGKAGVGTQLQGMASQNQADILAKLFGAFGQSNSLGTSQAQTVQTPSTLGQIAGFAGSALGGLGSLASAASPFGASTSMLGNLGHLFGIGGGGAQPTGGFGGTYSLPNNIPTSLFPQYPQFGVR
jgi:hypothetical protein